MNNFDFNTLREPFVIAEAGINHNGDIELAMRMIEVAKQSGADAIKFQTFKAEEFCGDPQQLFSYKSQGLEVTEPMLDMFKRVELSESTWKQLKSYAEQLKIEFLSTPQNLTDLEMLLSLGIRAIKIGSDDLTNEPLIREYASFGLPIILSSGMSDQVEIEAALAAAGYFNGNKVALLVCTSQYPTPSEDVNISRILTLKNMFPNLTVGFSDHTEGNEAAILGVGSGALIFEKHFTLDHNLPGPDHWFSPNPDELNSWVESIRKSYKMVGNGVLEPSISELEMRVLARRSITVIEKIRKGDEFTKFNIGQRRPGSGMAPKHIDRILGQVANKDLQVGHQVRPEDFN